MTKPLQPPDLGGGHRRHRRPETHVSVILILLLLSSASKLLAPLVSCSVLLTSCQSAAPSSRKSHRSSNFHMPPTAEESSRYRSAAKYLPEYNPEEEPLKPSSVPLDPSVLKPDDSCFVAQASTFNSTGVALHVSQNPRLEPPLDFTTDEPLTFFDALTHPKIHVPVTVTKPITGSKPPRRAAAVTFHSMGARVKTLILLLGQKPQSASPSAQYHHLGQTDLMLQQKNYQVKKKYELVESWL